MKRMRCSRSGSGERRTKVNTTDFCCLPTAARWMLEGVLLTSLHGIASTWHGVFNRIIFFSEIVQLANGKIKKASSKECWMLLNHLLSTLSRRRTLRVVPLILVHTFVTTAEMSTLSIFPECSFLAVPNSNHVSCFIYFPSHSCRK